MKLFKDSNDNIYAYELDGSQDHLIGNKTAITKPEADLIIASKVPSLTTEQLATQAAKASAQAKLASLGLTADEVKALTGA